MEAEEKGIKEILELLDGLRVILTISGKALEDGKLSFGDLTLIADLAKEYEVLVNAVKGSDEVLKELKDLDANEAQIVVTKLYDVIMPFYKALKGA